MKKTISLICLVLLMAGLLVVPAAAGSPYRTYTYSYAGDEQLSPDAYVFDENITGAGLGLSDFAGPSNLFCDELLNLYVADTGNDRIVCIDKAGGPVRKFAQFIHPDTGKVDALNGPKDVFVTREGYVYVADTGNGRIVVFDRDTRAALHVYDAPQAALLEDYKYVPEKLAVDDAGRMYVICAMINIGVVGLDVDGEFTGFVGAKRVTPSVGDLFWRLFMTKEQKAGSIKQVPSSYNNLAIDELGFLYLTTNTYKDWETQAYFYYRMQDDTYAPIRRLNSTGADILNRQGFFPPAGDVNFEIGHTARHGSSSIVDVALSHSGIYSLLDQKRGRVFTYDTQGNLLHAFGGLGVQDGLVGLPVAVCYQGERLLLLDAENHRVVAYRPTEYGQLLTKAIALNAERKFEEAAEVWQQVLLRNQNNHLAYAAMGQNYLTAEQYSEAMECFKAYGDVENYSLAFAGARDAVMRVLALPLIAVLLILAVLLFKLSGKLRRFNARVGMAAPSAGKPHRLVQQLCYSHHVIFHPFDGFYDIKREGRGSVASATVILAFTALTFVIKALCSGFIFGGGQGSAMDAVLTVLLPFFLWCAANWCLTTLMNGEGKFSHIYMAVAYSLVPLALFNIPLTILSNVFTLQEGTFVTFLFGAAMLWTGFLIFCGSLTVHNYSLPKNIITVLLTIVGIGVILFICLLFANVLQKMLLFFVNLFTEISFRL